MAQVTVTIAGKTYRMACADGEEAHLEGLAAVLDGRIQEMRSAFGEIGEMRLHVMAALTLADENAENRKRLDGLTAEVAALKEVLAGGDQRSREEESRLADALLRTADRIERAARALNATTSAP